MRRLVYFSNADLDLSLAAIERMVEEAAGRNRPLQISGLLLYNGLNFMQILEGPPQALTPLYLRIRKDARHSGVVKLADEGISARKCADWGMKLMCAPPECASLTQETSPCDTSGFPGMVRAFFGFGHTPAMAELR